MARRAWSSLAVGFSGEPRGMTKLNGHDITAQVLLTRKMISESLKMIDLHRNERRSLRRQIDISIAAMVRSSRHLMRIPEL
jgi:hypothetical protein